MFNVLSFDQLTSPTNQARQHHLGAQINQALLWLMTLLVTVLTLAYLVGLIAIPEPRTLFVLPLVVAAALVNARLVSKSHFKTISAIMLSLTALGLVIAFFNGYIDATLAPIYMLTLMANYRGRYRLLAPYILLGLHATLINIGPEPGAYEYQMRIFSLSVTMVYPLHLLFEAEQLNQQTKAKALNAIFSGFAIVGLAVFFAELFSKGSFLIGSPALIAFLMFLALRLRFTGLAEKFKGVRLAAVVAILTAYSYAVVINGMLPVTAFPVISLMFFLLLSSFNALMLSLALTLVSVLGIFTIAPSDVELPPMAIRLLAAAAIFSLALKALFKQLETEAGLPTIPLIAVVKVLPLSLAATAGVAMLMFDGLHIEQSSDIWTYQINLHAAQEWIGLLLTTLLFTWGFGSFWLRSYTLEKTIQQSNKLLSQLELALAAGEVSIYELDLESGDATFLAGYHPVLTVGDTINVNEYAHRVTSSADRVVIQRTLSSEKSECQFPARYQPNETPHWSRIITGAFYEVGGRRKNLYIRSDVTALQESLAAMRLSNERQRDLFAVIGHELRTPVASVDMITQDNEMPDAEKLINIREINHGLLNILDDMRTVVAPERAQSAEYVVGNPAKVVTRALTSLTTVLTEHGAAAEVSINHALENRFRYREQALRQLVTNLVKNAALHSGGTTIWVELSATQAEADLLSATLSVADNGKGIPEADLDLVFAAFGRGDTQSEGSGLGLYISRELARRLGGELSYQTSQHGGAQFSVTFPLEPVVDDQNAEAQIAKATPIKLDGWRILVAEDDGMLRILTEKALSKQGALVTLAVDGAKALEAYNSGEFDLVLTDLMMPNMTGEALTKALRSQGETLPIIAVTAAVIGEETDRLLEAGVDQVISKPISAEKLALALAGLKESDNNE